jgi:hypothetical protein
MIQENYEYRKILRSEIKNAPYNPRKIKKKNRENLASGLEEFGLLEPLVWNKRTGNLVGGHQRLKIIDDAAENNDFELGVSVVDLDERDEAKANILLNNPAAQGAFDFPKLREMKDLFDLEFDDIDIHTKFDEFLEKDYDDEDNEERDQNESEIIPLAFVIEREKWERVKKTMKCKDDSLLFEKIIERILG